MRVPMSEELPPKLAKYINEQVMDSVVTHIDGGDAFLWYIYKPDIEWVILVQWYPGSEEWDIVNLPKDCVDKVVQLHDKLR